MRSLLQRRRGSVRTLLRWYDWLALLGGVFAALAANRAVAPGMCSDAAAALPALILLGVAVALGVPRGRLPYGSAVELASLGVAAGVAGASTLVLGDAPLCPALVAASSWLVPSGLLAAPRLAALLLRNSVVEPVGAVKVRAPLRPTSFGRTAWILTLSRPVDEPRVRRQAEALSASGWNVVAIGFPGTASVPDYWTLVELSNDPRPRASVGVWMDVLNVRNLWAWVNLATARWSQKSAERFYWTERVHIRALEDLSEIAARGELGCDLIANHDFYTLPLAAALAERLRVPYTTDVHEYARGQYMHLRSFRLLTSHYVHSLQQRFFPRAELLTVVCEGIAQLLNREYRLKREALVVRNVSIYEAMPFNPTSEPIRVLYHGLVCEKRGLEEAITSLPLWRSEFELVIRGNGSEEYVEGLRRLARRLGVQSRVRFEPAVPLTELIAVANRCDIGFFASGDYSPQKRFTAPNKLFEYIMAGLAVCVSDLPEMRRIVKAHDVGHLFGALDAQTIARAINRFTREAIDAYKRRSLDAARILCWENERAPMIAAYDAIYRTRAMRDDGR